MFSGHIYRTKFLHKPSNFSPRVPSMLMHLPLTGDTFCSSCTRKGYLLPPSLSAFSGYGDPTRSLIHKRWPGGSSSLFFPARWLVPRLPILLLLSPWCRGTGMPSRAHRFSNPVLQGKILKSWCSVAEKHFLGFLYAKGEDSGCVEKLGSVLGFTRCLTFNLSNEPKI